MFITWCCDHMVLIHYRVHWIAHTLDVGNVPGGSLNILHLSLSWCLLVSCFPVECFSVECPSHRKIFKGGGGLEFFTHVSISIRRSVSPAVGANKYFTDSMRMIVLSGARHTDGERVPAGEPSHPRPDARYRTGDSSSSSSSAAPLELVSKTSERCILVPEMSTMIMLPCLRYRCLFGVRFSRTLTVHKNPRKTRHIDQKERKKKKENETRKTHTH